MLLWKCPLTNLCKIMRCESEWKLNISTTNAAIKVRILFSVRMHKTRVYDILTYQLMLLWKCPQNNFCENKRYESEWKLTISTTNAAMKIHILFSVRTPNIKVYDKLTYLKLMLLWKCPRTNFCENIRYESEPNLNTSTTNAAMKVRVLFSVRTHNVKVNGKLTSHLSFKIWVDCLKEKKHFFVENHRHLIKSTDWCYVFSLKIKCGPS
jgi:hypothetical protein